MRTTPLLLTAAGLGVSLGIVLLNTQKQSVAGSHTGASSIGVTSASVLSKKEEAVRPNRQRMPSAQPLRRVLTKAAAAPAVIPQPRPVTLLATIDKADIEHKHKLIANNVLMALPSKCRNALQHFYVKYEKQKHRGLAGKSVMILDGTVPDEEFRALFIHESGHNWDLGCLQGTQAAGKSAFSDGDEPIYTDDPSVGFYQISWITGSVQKSTANPEDFVSGYAGYDIFEDFAESFAYFILHNEMFAARAENNEALAKKYAFLRDVVFDGVVPSVATGKSMYKGKAPWDITKLPYIWTAQQVVAAT